MLFEPLADESGAEPNEGYLYLKGHPGRGAVGCCPKQIALSERIKGYRGPEIVLDLNDAGEVIGIEVIES